VFTSFPPLGDVDGAFAAADRIIELTLVQTGSPTSHETRGAVADYDPASRE